MLKTLKLLFCSQMMYEMKQMSCNFFFKFWVSYYDILYNRHDDLKSHKRGTTQSYRSGGSKSAHATPSSPLKASKTSTSNTHHTNTSSSMKRGTRHTTGSTPSAKR